MTKDLQHARVGKGVDIGPNGPAHWAVPLISVKRAPDSAYYLKRNEKSKHLESSSKDNHVDSARRADQAVFGDSLGALGNKPFTHLIIASTLHLYSCKHHSSSAICM